MMKKIFSFIVVFVLMFGFFGVAHAQDKPLLPANGEIKMIDDPLDKTKKIPDIAGHCRDCGTDIACKKYCGSYNLSDAMYVGVDVSKIFLGVTGSLALGAFVYAGVLFLISGGNSETVGKAKKVMIGAVIGVAVVFASYMVVNFIYSGLSGEDNKFKGNSTQFDKP